MIQETEVTRRTAMSRGALGKTEDRHERADRISREILHAERIAREKKTAHLRALRLQRDRDSTA